MRKETLGLANAVERAAARSRQMRARASNIVDVAAERSRNVYDGAVNEAAEAMSSASDTLEVVGERAQSTGNAIRKRSKRAARAINRGETNLRAYEPRTIVDSAAAAMRRHSFAFTVAGAAALAYFTLKVIRREA
jgi:hypothetical protein